MQLFIFSGFLEEKKNLSLKINTFTLKYVFVAFTMQLAFDFFARGKCYRYFRKHGNCFVQHQSCSECLSMHSNWQVDAFENDMPRDVS